MRPFPEHICAVLGPNVEGPAGKEVLGGGWFGPTIDQVTIACDEPSDNAYNVIVENVASPLPSYIRITAICAMVQ